MNETHAEDVSAASAAYAFNVLPAISDLPPPEAFRRLYDLFYTAILAYSDALNDWNPPQPSVN